mmetsp:Transcript_5191/g.14626  ORF Transcript_5191/g.14626 Transcript_5191/m.14626 type:complete len:251 (-) Transcript_5191:746-1498(-)
MSVHLLAIPPGIFCKPFARSPSSSATHGDPVVSFVSFFCSLLASRFFACSSASSVCLRFHSAISAWVVASTLVVPSSFIHRLSSCSEVSSRHIVCKSSAAKASSLQALCTRFFRRCRSFLESSLLCCLCSFSARSFSSRSAFSCASCLCRSSSSRFLASSSSCFNRAFLSFSSRFFASFSSLSARIRGSRRSAVSASLKMRFRSPSTYFLRPLWFCLSIQRRSSRNSASSRLYSSCIEKSLHVSKFAQKS